VGLPKLFTCHHAAFLHRPRALVVEVRFPALVEYRAIAGAKCQIVAIPHSIESIVEIEAVFIWLDGDGIEILASRMNESGNIGIENLRVCVLLGLNQSRGAASPKKRYMVGIDDAFVAYLKPID
jgi:hypothetical protein